MYFLKVIYLLDIWMVSCPHDLMFFSQSRYWHFSEKRIQIWRRKKTKKRFFSFFKFVFFFTWTDLLSLHDQSFKTKLCVPQWDFNNQSLRMQFTGLCKKEQFLWNTTAFDFDLDSVTRTVENARPGWQKGNLLRK